MERPCQIGPLSLSPSECSVRTVGTGDEADERMRDVLNRLRLPQGNTTSVHWQSCPAASKSASPYRKMLHPRPPRLAAARLRIHVRIDPVGVEDVDLGPHCARAAHTNKPRADLRYDIPVR